MHDAVTRCPVRGPGPHDPDRDVDDGFDMHAIVGMQQRQEDMDEDYDEIQRIARCVCSDERFCFYVGFVCVGACVGACVRACVRACVCVCVCACVVVVVVGFVVVVVSFRNTSLSQALPDVLRLFFQKNLKTSLSSHFSKLNS